MQMPSSIVLCKPLRVTEILLAPGESVENAAAGDTERWMIQPVDGRVLVKPKAASIETNLIILTSPPRLSPDAQVRRRNTCRASPFTIPVEIVAAEANRKTELERRAKQSCNAGSLGQARLRLHRLRSRCSLETSAGLRRRRAGLHRDAAELDWRPTHRH